METESRQSRKRNKVSLQGKEKVFVGTRRRQGSGGQVIGESKRKVFVGMSGGVDSSVAAALLKQQGYDVTGIHLRCWNVDGCAEQDAEDARRAAEAIGIPFYTFDFEKEYRDRVVSYMVEGYRSGITPNPDVMCNREIKFGLFLEKALSMGADYVATGHYVKISEQENPASSTRFARPAARSLVLAARPRHKVGDRARTAPEVSESKIFSLYGAKDANKDQSYFLWTLTQGDLRHCLFPIGNYVKPQVRVLAREFGLPNAEKKDSQGICFLGKVTLPDFLEDYIPARRGKVLSASGEVVGEHRGAAFYTIGQRHLGVNLQLTTHNLQKRKRIDRKPFYVAEKDVKTNTLVVAEGSDNPALYRKEVELVNVNLIQPLATSHSSLVVYARVRYRQPLAQANLQLKTKNLQHAKLIFRKAQKFVAPGQSAVFYSKSGEMLGGGIIAP